MFVFVRVRVVLIFKKFCGRTYIFHVHKIFYAHGIDIAVTIIILGMRMRTTRTKGCRPLFQGHVKSVILDCERLNCTSTNYLAICPFGWLMTTRYCAQL